MVTRRAACSCGQLRLVVEGEPIRISICHCLECRRRTGSAFGAQVRFPAAAVRIEGRSTQYVRRSDEGEPRTFHFCPDCGATVYWRLASVPDAIVVALGAFVDASFPPPTVSVYDSRRHPWLTLPASIERHG